MTTRPPVLPPGNILQHLYLRERLAELPAGSFVEVGSGIGVLLHLLVGMGWRGEGWELDDDSVRRARELNADAIGRGDLRILQGDWLRHDPEESFDLVISGFVLEHLDERDEARFLERCAESLRPGGRLMLMVPGSPEHWGIEDEIAGHFRRYTTESLSETLSHAGFSVDHVAGLTYPLSNMLLPLSNRLVARAEGDKVDLSMEERTQRSGNRAVEGKTTFPGWTRILLNRFVLYPFHVLQKAFRTSPNALILYAEARLDGNAHH